MTQPAFDGITYTSRDVAATEIKSLLGMRDMNQTDLAARVHHSKQWVSARLKREVPLTTDDIDLIAAALGVKPARLLQPSPDSRATLSTSSARSSTDRASDYGSEGSRILHVIDGGLRRDSQAIPAQRRLSLITRSG